MTKRMLLLVAVLVLYAAAASAATIPVSTCEQPAVQAAVEAATDGDTLQMPVGNCTWPTHVSWANKDITILGAGVGKTVIKREGGDNGFVFWVAISDATKGRFRIAHMTLQGTVQTSVIYVTSGAIAAIPAGRWRVDHVHFDFPTGQRSGVHTTGVNYGVVDHNLFTWNDGVAIRQANQLQSECYGGSPLAGDFQNAQPLDLGTDKFLFVEDNVFTPAANRPLIAYDASAGGGRVTFRYNSVTGGFLYNHWTRGCELAAQVFEVYNNRFIGTAGYGAPMGAGYMMRFEAGTGKVFNNTVENFRINGHAPYVFIDDRRAAKSEASGFLGACDGTKSHDGNAGDPAAPGWPCLGQIGRAPGKTLAQIQAGDKPASSPLALWNNGEEPTCATGGPCTNTLEVYPEPAAYIKSTPHPNGEVDFTIGTPTPGYTPYVYPHPLVSGTEPTPVPPDPVPPDPVPPSGDTQAPAVRITRIQQSGNSPNHAVTVETTDNVEVVKVVFFVDNEAQPTLVAPPWRATVKIGNGSHTVLVKASDAAGNVGTASQTVVR